MKGKTQNGAVSEQLVSYAIGHIETWLEILAKTHAVPFPELSERVSEVFSHQNGEFRMGGMPEVPPERNGIGSSNGVQPLAIRSHAHGKLPSSAAHDPAEPAPEEELNYAGNRIIFTGLQIRKMRTMRKHGASMREVAKRFAVSDSTLYTWQKQTGEKL